MAAAESFLRRLVPTRVNYDKMSAPGLNLEGTTPNIRRGLFYYETLLRFNRRLLAGQKVLDFGCGYSNIGPELIRDGVHCEELALVDKNTTLLKHNPDVITVDGRNLVSHFNSRHFGVTLALFSTYQIPLPDRFCVFEQLAEVTSQALHIGPIFGEDLVWWSSEAEKLGLELTACLPFRGNWRQEEIFQPESFADYQKFVRRYSIETRIKTPQGDCPVIITSLLGHTLDYMGSNYLVLKRR